MGDPYVQPKTDPLDDQSVIDNINTDDSASNVSSIKGPFVKSRSCLSRISSTSFAHIKAKADQVALMEHVSALKSKHQIEADEEKLKIEKGKLELEMELAATSAKLKVLEISSQCGSQFSDGMNSYFEKNNSQEGGKLNPNADSFVPDEVDEMVNT